MLAAGFPDFRGLDGVDMYVYCRCVCSRRMEVCWSCGQFDNGHWRAELRKWKNLRRRNLV